MNDLRPNKKKRSMRRTRNLVTVSTHIPLTNKLTLEALALSLDKSVYELLQDTIIEMTDKYDAELEEMRKNSPKSSQVEGDEGLLG